MSHIFFSLTVNHSTNHNKIEQKNPSKRIKKKRRNRKSNKRKKKEKKKKKREKQIKLRETCDGRITFLEEKRGWVTWILSCMATVCWAVICTDAQLA